MKLRIKKKSFRSSFIFISGTLCSVGAFSMCIAVDNLKTARFSMDTGQVILPNDTPIGAVFFRKTFVIDNYPSGTLARCVTGGSIVTQQRLGFESSVSPHIWHTDVSGVGYRLKAGFTGFDPVDLPVIRNNPPSTNIYFFGSRIFVLELIKLRDVPRGGSIGSGPIMDTIDDYGTRLQEAYISSAISRVVLPSCSSLSSDIVVPLGKISSKSFGGKRTTTGEKNFSIRLLCQKGENFASSVYLRLDANAETSVNQPGILELAGKGRPGVAGGVGIKLTRNSEPEAGPVQFGKAALVGPAIDGIYELSFSASYVQVGDKITPGRADGTATFTIEYK